MNNFISDFGFLISDWPGGNTPHFSRCRRSRPGKHQFIAE
jgi:hypothetical protein